jgi:PAS domain S-box-containing protein
VDLTTASYEKLWSVLWDHSITGLALVAKDGTFLRVNPAFSRIVEYTESELRTRSFQEITHPDDVRADEATARDVSEGRLAYYDMAKRYITKTGSVRWVSLRGSRIALDDGTFVLFIAQVTLHDVHTEVAATAAHRKLINPMPWITSNWLVMAATLSAIAVIVASVIERLSKPN